MKPEEAGDTATYICNPNTWEGHSVLRAIFTFLCFLWINSNSCIAYLHSILLSFHGGVITSNISFLCRFS